MSSAISLAEGKEGSLGLFWPGSTYLQSDITASVGGFQHQKAIRTVYHPRTTVRIILKPVGQPLAI